MPGGIHFFLMFLSVLSVLLDVVAIRETLRDAKSINTIYVDWICIDCIEFDNFALDHCCVSL